jgi:hypothetical protein
MTSTNPQLRLILNNYVNKRDGSYGQPEALALIILRLHVD